MKKQYKSPKIKSFVVEMESPIADSPFIPVKPEEGVTPDQAEAKRHYRLIIDDDDDEDEEW